MPQSLHVKYSHIVFSTKNRGALIPHDIEPHLYDYLGGIIRRNGAHLMEVGGMPDHVHLIIRDSKSVADITLVREIKGGSSKWMNEKPNRSVKFAWQAGYGWFSVGPCALDKARAYVRNQREHHKHLSFQDEYRRFLERYQVDYDERYVWD